MKKLFLFVLVLVSAFSLEAHGGHGGGHVHGGHGHGRGRYRHYYGHRGLWRGGPRHWRHDGGRWWRNDVWLGLPLFAYDTVDYANCDCPIKVYRNGVFRGYKCSLDC